MKEQIKEQIRYKTKQREQLLDYLKTVPGKHITVGEICGFLRDNGAVISTTTVYRQLEKMVNEGIVNKYIIDANSPACFEYIEKEINCHEHECFHCKCEKCGKLFHMHSEELEELQEELKAKHRFSMDPRRTVFYGVCDACDGRKEK